MLEEIVERLKQLGYPVAENYFHKTKQKSIPEPPYIVWLCEQKKGRGADFLNNIRELRACIELYTEKRADKGIEKQIEEKVLFDLEYESHQTTIEAEELVRTVYEFEIVEKGGRK